MDHGMAKLAAAIAALFLALIFSTVPALAYKNYTVGGSAGWFFNDTNNSTSTNYSSWAAAQTFSLGDFLIFNTNTNTTVVQTYNATTYRLCTAEDDYGNDTFVYSDDGSNGFGPMVAEVPLTVEGPNYYFSDAGVDTVQCINGMRFEINVSHGQGIPPELSPPSPGSKTPPAPRTVGNGAPPTGRNDGSRRCHGGDGRLLVALVAVFVAVL